MKIIDDDDLRFIFFCIIIDENDLNVVYAHILHDFNIPHNSCLIELARSFMFRIVRYTSIFSVWLIILCIDVAIKYPFKTTNSPGHADTWSSSGGGVGALEPNCMVWRNFVLDAGSRSCICLRVVNYILSTIHCTNGTDSFIRTAMKKKVTQRKLSEKNCLYLLQ